MLWVLQGKAQVIDPSAVDSVELAAIKSAGARVDADFA